MINWTSILSYDPISALYSRNNEAVSYFVARDLIGNDTKSVETLWELTLPKEIVKAQQSDGSWKYPGGDKHVRSQENYNQIETYRNLGYLVEMFAFNKEHPAIRNATDFLFSFQTEEGDIRGILGNQYTPYYTAAMLELIIKAGYVQDERVDKAFKWLEAIRQNDGGWAIPFRTRHENLYIIASASGPLEPDRSKPFSHMVTGIVLRAYAAHAQYRDTVVAKEAGKLLLCNMFKKDNYVDRQNADFWLRFNYPFWFTDLISAMDTLSILGFAKDEPQMQKALEWFLIHQGEDGLWKLKALKNKKIYDTELWLSLAICRIIKRLYN